MEVQIVQYFQQVGYGTIVDKISEFISRMPFLGMLCFVIFGWILVKFKQRWKLVCASFFLSGVLFFLLSTLGMKRVFVDVIGFRERPYVAHADHIHLIGTSFADTSFPSDHMASTLAMLTVIIFFVPGAWPFAIIFALMMGFSRMHNGMHYPSDVLAGTILGICYGLLGIGIAKKVVKKRE